MKPLKMAALALTASLLLSCEKDVTFTIDTSTLKQAYNPSENISLQLKNDFSVTLDSVVYYNNGSRLGKVTTKNTPFVIRLNNQKLGYQNLKALVFYEGKSAEATVRVELFSGISPKLLSYTIKNTYPHDIQAYTQGLEFYNDTLVEGTGTWENSFLQKINFKNNTTYKRINLPAQTFGEGITVLKGKLYQLTYQKNECYVYNPNTLAKLQTLQYFKKMEGWGLTNDGTNLWMSDGSEKIYTVNPETFTETGYINIYTDKNKITQINELEWVNGYIWANVYQMNALVKINPKNGAIEALVDLTDLQNKITKHPQVDVLNGIAYNPKTQTFFVTGKNWDKLFELSLNQ